MVPSLPFGVVLAKGWWIICDWRCIRGGGTRDQIRKKRSFRINVTHVYHPPGGKTYRTRSRFERQRRFRLGHSLLRGVSIKIKNAPPYERGIYGQRSPALWTVVIRKNACQISVLVHDSFLPLERRSGKYHRKEMICQIHKRLRHDYKHQA